MRKFLNGTWIARAVVVAILALLVAASPSAEAGKKKCTSVRFTNGLDHFELVVDQMLNGSPGKEQKGALLSMQHRLKKCLKSLKAEFSLAHRLAHGVEFWGKNPDKTPGVLRSALSGEVDDLAVFYERRGREEVDRMESLVANLRSQGFETDREEALIVKAREVIQKVNAESDSRIKLSGLVGVARLARKINNLTRISKTKPSCEGRRLKAGEYCNAIVGGQVAHFQVGKGTIQLDRDGNISRVRIMFHSCPDRDFIGATVLFSVPPTLGTHDVEGDTYSRGDGSGFGLRMRAGSTLTVTAINLDQGYIAGTFEFTTAGSGARNAEFRLTSVK